MTDALNNGVWDRFRRHRTAYWSLAVFLGLLTTAVLLAPFSTQWFNVQDLSKAVRAAPTSQPVTGYAVYSEQFGGDSQRGLRSSIARKVYGGAGWMGYDALGRSLLFRTLFGWLVSMGIGLGAAIVSVTLGVAWGATAGLVGGRLDAAMMRVVDVMYSLPYVLFVILLMVVLEEPLSALFGRGSPVCNFVILFLAIGAVSWLTMARLVRGQVLSLRAQPFVEAAYAGGASTVRVMWRHLLPNLAGPVIVCATLVIPQAILQESFLSFLGIGVQAPTPSLGRLAADGVESVNTFVGFWWLITFPCGILVLTLLALNFIGDGLRGALDPKSGASVII